MSSIGSSNDYLSTATYGYGLPTKGTYNLSILGYKTFGSIGQGPSPISIKDDSENST